MRRTACFVAFVALGVPGSAAAHANLVQTVPGDGAVVSKAPSRILVIFDDVVRVGPANEAVRNGGGSVLAGKPRARLKVLELPLRSGLGKGDYSVRWSALSDDGHEEEGVFAFAVGTAPPPVSVLRPGGEIRFWNVLTRWLFFSGLLMAGGLALFDLVVWRPLARRSLRTGWLALGLAAVFFSAVALVYEGHAGVSTRFGLVLAICALIAGAGATLAVMGIVDRMAAFFALILALALLPIPTLAGHSLDPGRWWTNAPIDFLHVIAVAFWFGSLVALAVIVPKAGVSSAVKSAAVRRCSGLALVTVLVIAATGIGRGVGELGSLSHLWTTNYGRAIIVKTALFGLLLALGWVSRGRIAAGYAKLRASVAMEVVVLVVLLGAVAVLTALPPGRTLSAAKAATPKASGGLVRLPATDATVLGQRDGKLAAAIAVRRSGAAMATFVGSDAKGVDVGQVTIDGQATRTCGLGCYSGSAGTDRIVTVAHGGTTLRFDLGLRRPAPRFVAGLDRAYRRLRSTVYSQRIDTGLGSSLSALWTEVAPDSFSYRIANGAEAIVIGRRRWDRDPGQAWRVSATPITRVPTPIWTGAPTTNVHMLRRGRRDLVVSFLRADRTYPAWFTVVVDRRKMNILTVQMTAASHFMHVRYISWNESIAFEPPS